MLLIELFAYVIFACITDAHILRELKKGNMKVVTLDVALNDVAYYLSEIVEFIKSDNTTTIPAEIGTAVSNVRESLKKINTHVLSLYTYRRTVMLGLLGLCAVCGLVFLWMKKPMPQTWMKFAAGCAVAIIGILTLFGFVEDLVNRRESSMKGAIKNFTTMDATNMDALSDGTHKLLKHVPGIKPSVKDSVSVIVISSIILIASVAAAVMVWRMEESDVTDGMLHGVISYFALVCLITTMCFFYNRLDNAIG